jgi:hypothetical protein
METESDMRIVCVIFCGEEKQEAQQNLKTAGRMVSYSPLPVDMSGDPLSYEWDAYSIFSDRFVSDGDFRESRAGRRGEAT